MAQRDIVNRSLETGKDVTQRTQERIEALMRDLAKVAEDQTNQAQQLVQELVERSRTTTEQIVEVIDRELRSQLNAVGLATRADIERLENKIEELRRQSAGGGTSKAAAGKASAKKAAAKKASATSAAKKAPAKRSAKKAASGAGRSR